MNIKNNILKRGSKNLGYENWMVYHPNGSHMFTCNEKKAKWYLERDLAKVTGDNKIKLTFEPKGRGFHDNEIFGRSIRETRCVVCGEINDLQRHHIVPYCYRTYFPEEYKSKNHHDVVLINHEIHQKYEVFANKFKNEIAEMYDVETITDLNLEYTQALRDMSKQYSILLNAIHMLFKTDKVPYEIKIEKLKFISNEIKMPYSFIKKINYIQLYKLYLLIKEERKRKTYIFKREHRASYDHGYHVVKKLDTEEKIREFVKLWRNHFIDTMQPQFMPNGWSIDFRIKTKI